MTADTAATSPEMTTGPVVSADRTRIGYLRLGQGPAVVMPHASMEPARSHLRLARALAGAFTVDPPNRPACPTGAAAACPARTRPAMASAPRPGTCRPSRTNRARSWSSRSAPAAWPPCRPRAGVRPSASSPATSRPR